MNSGDFTRSQYLTSTDVTEPLPVTIEDCTTERIGFAKAGQSRAQDKLVLWFREIDSGLPLNRTNIKALTALCGSEETADWIDARICPLGTAPRPDETCTAL